MAKREMRTKNVEETKAEQSEVVTNETAKPETGGVEKGIVVDCVRLKIRKEPKKEAHVVSVVDAGAELRVIDRNEHDGDWYKVITANKVHGYCMKKYVKLG